MIDPPALRNRPTLRAKLLYFRNVFIQLSDSRSFTQTGRPLPIPISEYAAYCEFFGITSLQERELLFKLVRAQDKAYVTHIYEKSKQTETDNKVKPAVAPT